jgi:hemolysin activation/secretion protein
MLRSAVWLVAVAAVLAQAQQQQQQQQQAQPQEQPKQVKPQETPQEQQRAKEDSDDKKVAGSDFGATEIPEGEHCGASFIIRESKTSSHTFRNAILLN